MNDRKAFLWILIIILWVLSMILLGCSADEFAGVPNECELLETGDIAWGTGNGAFEGIGVGNGTTAVAGNTVAVLDSDRHTRFTTEIVIVMDYGVEGVLFLMFEQPQPIPDYEFYFYEVYQCRQ